MVVSAGTYVRALVRDLGVALGCGAAVASLRRTAIGPLSVDGALAVPADKGALRDAARGTLVPIDAMPLDLPSVILTSPADSARFSAGVAVTIDPVPLEGETLAAVRGPEGTLLGVGLAAGRSLSPRVVLPREG